MRAAAVVLVAALAASAGVPDDVTELDLDNGLHVITRTLQGNEIEGVSLFFVGGSRVLDEETQGLERFALECAAMGSVEYPGPAWRELMDRTRAEWTGSYNYDYSRFHLRCLREDLPDLLATFGSCLREPELDPAAVEQVRESILRDLLSKVSDPDSWIWYVANDAFMPGHTYRMLPDGTRETVTGFTADDVLAFLDERLHAGNLLVTHAGPTPPDELEEILEESFGWIPPGGTELPEVEPFEVPRDTLALQQRAVPTAYVVVKLPAPSQADPDLVPFRAGMAVIDEMLWQVLRTESALTYATFAGATSYEENWGYMYVSTPQPVAACSLMAGVMSDAASGGLDRAVVTGTVERMATMDAMGSAERSVQCRMLGSGWITAGDWAAPFREVDAMAGLAPEDISAALDRWVRSGAWGVIADTTVVPADDLHPWPLR